MVYRYSKERSQPVAVDFGWVAKRSGKPAQARTASVAKSSADLSEAVRGIMVGGLNDVSNSLSQVERMYLWLVLHNLGHICDRQDCSPLQQQLGTHWD